MYEIKTPGGRKYKPPPGRCWVTVEPEYMRLKAEGRMWFGSDDKGMPRKKTYLHEHEGRMSWSWWTNDDVGNTQESKKEIITIFGEDAFATPKPERLLQRILPIATNPGDLVLDSFLGSGTTAAVAHKMGRRWIGVEMGDHARTHCALRLQKVIEGEQGGISKNVGWEGGGGFRFAKLGAPVFLPDGRINPEIRFADLAAHIWFNETRAPLAAPPETLFLGAHEGKGVALRYNGILKDRSPGGGNVLIHAVLKTVREAAAGFDGPLTVYGAACRLSDATLEAQGVTFRQIPYDIGARI